MQKYLYEPLLYILMLACTVECFKGYFQYFGEAIVLNSFIQSTVPHN